MPQALITELIDTWAGKPILVLGGGPSVGTDLPKLGITPACVISANDHGVHQTRFPVDLLVNVDKMHCMLKQPMQSVLRPLGIPIVNRHSWADYRLPDWRLAGNSGLVSIAVACALGGNPVIVTGIDMWHTGRVYFHDAPTVNRRDRELRVRPGVTRRDIASMRPLAVFTKGANIRPMSGPLCTAFPKYNADEALPTPQDISYRKHLREVVPVLAEPLAKLKFSNLDVVMPGTPIALSLLEFNGTLLAGKVRRLR